MSEDRLEKALEAIKDESVDRGQLEEARNRVWAKLEMPSAAACAEFESEIRNYMDSKLEEKRRLLMEDHLSRCPSCRARMAEQKGERKPVPIQSRRTVRMPKWIGWAAAAVLFIGALYAGRESVYSFVTQNSPRATVVSSTGGLYLVPNGLLKAGSKIGESAVIRTGPGARAKLQLSDGSQMNMNEGTELFIHAALSGKTIHLQRGDIIVHAAKQRLGHLQVQTRNSVASVKGTIFAVSAGISGTLVSVVEGSVAVTQPGTEVLLSPGQQAASNSALVNSVQSAISWSPDAETYIAILASFVNVQRQIAASPSPSLSAQSRLLQYIPANTIVYGAAPNLGGVANQAVSLYEQQAAENPTFNQWWNSSASQGLKQMLGKIQTFMPLLGNEIAYGMAMNLSTTPGDAVPMLFAEAGAGKQTELAAALEEFRAQMGSKPFQYVLSDKVLAISDSQTHLQWLLDHMGQGASTPFADEIAARYQAGAGSLLGLDIGSVSAFIRNPAAQMIGAQGLKHIFFQQRNDRGAKENEMAISFQGPRTGIASFLAGAGSGGAAEYITRDSIVSFYAATREPQQMIEEVMAIFSRLNPSFQNNLAGAESKLGISFINDFAQAFGAESAFSVEGLSATGPVWSMAALVNDKALLENTIHKFVDAINAALAQQGKPGRIGITAESVDGRMWTTMKFSELPASLTWTYDRGYMVAGSDRGSAARALTTRNGGSPLIFSDAFQRQLPSMAGLHPSGFLWMNAKGALGGLPIPIQNPAIQKLLAAGEPILVTLSGTTEQIRVVSRTQVSSMIMNLMMLQGANRASSPGGNAVR
jgi:hypothetical protein